MLIAGSFQPLFGLSTVTINYDKGECNDNLWLYDTNIVVRCIFFTLRHTLLNTHTISYYHNYQNTADRLNIWSHQIDILSHHVLSWRVDPETSTDKSPKAVQGCNTAQEFQTHCSSFTAIRILSWNRVDSNCTRFHSFSPSRNYMNSGHPGRSAGPGK